MPQGTQNNPRSIQEMLENAQPVQDVENISEIEQLKRELAQKDKLILEQQQEMGREEAFEKGEGTPIVSKEVLANMVETVQGTKEMKERIETIPSDAPPQVDTSQKTVAAQKQKAALKVQLVDDIATISKLNRPKQVKALVMMALQKGVHYSFDVAKGIQSPYLLDEFHDALAVEMKQVLCERKKIKDC